MVIRTLAALGAPRSLDFFFVKGSARDGLAVAALVRSIRGVLDDPTIPGIFEEVGMMNYWKATHTRPDHCRSKGPPAFYAD